MQNISALPMMPPKATASLTKKPLPPPPQPTTAPRHYYEDIDQCTSADSKQKDVPNSIRCFPPKQKFNKPADATKKLLESTSKSPHNTQVNGNNEIHKKLLEMEEKIGVILSRLSQLENDVKLLKSKQLMDAEPVPLVIHNDTSPAQVFKNLYCAFFLNITKERIYLHVIEVIK